MASVAELKGRPVISLAEGERLGDIREVAIDPTARQIAGFVLKGDGGDTYLPWRNVKKIGPDAVMVDNRTMTERVENADPYESLAELGKLPVISDAGAQLGHVENVTFDDVSGALQAFELKSGGVFGIGAKSQSIAMADVVSVGTGAITVATAGEAK
ncbi:MAG: PRC-barrel domain-containing protein [Fimbriimonadaceae bacterium]|nr:PRC-barrel domain-containing protein [Fimbriimonadaceae bacterium]